MDKDNISEIEPHLRKRKGRFVDLSGEDKNFKVLDIGPYAERREKRRPKVIDPRKELQEVRMGDESIAVHVSAETVDGIVLPDLVFLPGVIRRETGEWETSTDVVYVGSTTRFMIDSNPLVTSFFRQVYPKESIPEVTWKDILQRSPVSNVQLLKEYQNLDTSSFISVPKPQDLDTAIQASQEAFASRKLQKNTLR